MVLGEIFDILDDSFLRQVFSEMNHALRAVMALNSQIIVERNFGREIKRGRGWERGGHVEEFSCQVHTYIEISQNEKDDERTASKQMNALGNHGEMMIRRRPTVPATIELTVRSMYEI